MLWNGMGGGTPTTRDPRGRVTNAGGYARSGPVVKWYDQFWQRDNRPAERRLMWDSLARLRAEDFSEAALPFFGIVEHGLR